MKRRSPNFQFLAAPPVPTIVDSAAAMSSRPLFGGYPNQRGYSSGSSYDRGRGVYVNADPLYQSIREENLGFSHGNNSRFEQSPINPRTPPPNQNYDFRQPPVYSQRPQYWRPRLFVPNQQSSPFNYNHGVRPHQFQPHFPKPLDFRNWEYAKTPMPSGSDCFTILSYNILADYLAISHRSKLYFHIPHYMMDWGWRKRNITFELGLWSADIMCFQEVDRFSELEEELGVRGYKGIWKMRTGTPTDGCATFWRTSRFKLLHEECIEFSKLGLRDNVAQICVFELNKQNINENAAVSSTSLEIPKRVVVCNIHVLYNPKRGEIKLGQIRILLNKAHVVSKLWNDARIVLCGDFNCTPKSALYNFISDQKLDLSGLHRDKVSGQDSAEILATQPHHFNSRLEPANDSIQSGDSRKVDSGDYDWENKKNSDNSGNNIPSMINSLPKLSNGVQNVDTVLRDEVKTESQSYSTKEYRDESESFVCGLDQKFREGSNSSFAADTNDAIDGVDPSELIYSDKIYSNLTGGKSGLTTDAISFSTHGDEFSQSNMHLVDTQLSKTRIHPETANSLTATISSHELSSQNSLSDNVKPSIPGRQQNLPSHLITESESGSSLIDCLDNTPCQSTSIDLVVDDKLSSLKRLDGVTLDERIVEDDCIFSSALHTAEDIFPCELGSDNTKDFDPVSHNSLLHEPSLEVMDDPLRGFNSEDFEVAQTIYDPSLWAPMDIQNATGSSDCTLLKHSLKLRSTYTEVEDVSGSRDMNGEPLVTSYNRRFLGTVDYIWRSEGLQTVKVLAPIPKHAMQWTPGFPTKKWGSDHIALASELAFIDDTVNKTESQ